MICRRRVYLCRSFLVYIHHLILYYYKQRLIRALQEFISSLCASQNDNNKNENIISKQNFFSNMGLKRSHCFNYFFTQGYFEQKFSLLCCENILYRLIVFLVSKKKKKKKIKNNSSKNCSAPASLDGFCSKLLKYFLMPSSTYDVLFV